MGKPSCTQLAKKASNQSLGHANTTKMNIPSISTQKTKRAKKKRLQKTNDTIKKLFTQLRSESRSESSIINLDESRNSALNNTILNDDVSITGIIPAKDNNLELRKTTLNAPIIIQDEPSVSTPNKHKYALHHSTPIKKPSSDEVILAASNRILNDSNNNKTKEINASSFLTIDLTTDTSFYRSTQPTVIDLDVTNEQPDLIITSISNASSMSGDSEVTVLRRPTTDRSLTRQIKNNIANLNKRDKDKILAFLSENIFNGCTTPTKLEPRAPETAEDTYIKDVIIGRKISRNSIGSNIYNPQKYVNTTGLRMIVIDGSNVAMAHSNHHFFSVPGLKIVIEYFLSRGHVVKAFVPRFRNKSGMCSHPQMLINLERQGHVVFTPSREVAGRNITSYDDRYIIQCAAEFEGIIVSNDQFKDLFNENPRWRTVIQSKVLPYNWVNDMIMFPRDPLGRNGPTLEQFLKMPLSR